MTEAEESQFQKHALDDLVQSAPIAGVVVSGEKWKVIRGRFVIFAIVSLLLSFVTNFFGKESLLGISTPMALIIESIGAGFFYFLIAVLFGGLFRYGTARGVFAILIAVFLTNQHWLMA